MKRVLTPPSTPGVEMPYEVALYTHVLGEDAVVTTYDYKKRDTAYDMLSFDAFMLRAIAEKQSKYKTVNAAVPRVLAEIDKAGRLILIREFVTGVTLSKLPTLSAKCQAYVECTKELERVTRSLTDEEKARIPVLTMTAMSKRFPRLVMKALVLYPDRVREILKIAYTFYRNGERKKSRLILANRALTPEHIVCGRAQVFMCDFRNSVIAPEGTDIALFPELYYREVGNETMRQFLDEQTATVEDRRRFLQLAAFNALDRSDEAYLPVLAGAIIPYVRQTARTKSVRGSLTLAVSEEPS